MSGPTWHPPKTGGSAAESAAPPLGFRQPKVAPPSALRTKDESLEQNGGLNSGGGRGRYPSPQSGLAPTSCSEDPRLSRPSLITSNEHRYPPGPAGREAGIQASWSQAQPQVAHEIQTRPQEKTMNRPSSIDAEIDSLTSMLADMQNNSPFHPRPRQNYDNSLAPYHPQPPPPPAPVPPKHAPPYKPLAQSPVTAATRAPGQPEAYPGPRPVAYGNAGAYPSPGAPRPYPQPVAASYTTASTSAGTPFNVQVKVAQPVPNYTQPGRQAEQAYGPPPPRQAQAHQLPEPPYRAPQPRYPEPSYASAPEPHPPPASPSWYPATTHFSGGPAGLPDPHYGPEGMYGPRRPELAFYGAAHKPPGQFQHFGGKKGAYGEDLPPPPPPPTAANLPKVSYGALGGAQPQASRPEEELDRITKKLVHDMNNPPSEEYFGRCARCGENVVGDGTGCVAMEQVFHVECFTCMTCHCRLRGRPFYAIDKKSYCESCYINTLEQCSVCSKPIMDRILRAMGRAYHPQCFTCVVCHRCLDGIPFTVDATSQIHCIEDFHMKFAPRCCVCAEPIMPEAGQEETVRIVALDRSFHVTCYKCEDCGFVLSSEGEGCGCYPLDGHILCKSCSARRIQHLSSKITTDC
ncbi:thyroid receptor-interacting protein 6 isoform X2 [Pristis pectinata]|nr:thyroid receptor-interacting protein 6 isoform X2 [Pristis pectinata]XP_051900575.1 thyroid receptor-interacting protein 6 isoform X2 [Pristis pectinata]XP_051900576.1 thyroid receptor-interacting protein 6 isoform X2 [Pristis pectinata]XP_051900578.1 thyroid receptor-interacting protein 6 isoform X2 [Pristis pectinata]